MQEPGAPARRALLRAASVAERVQQEAASVLYQRLVSPGGPAKVAALAELLGVGQSTVYRQCSGEIPVQLRTLAPLAALDLEGFRLLFDGLGRALGLKWQWHPQAVVPASVADAMQMVTEVSLACFEAALAEVGALRDGTVTAEELAELERRWAHEDYTREQMRAQVRAMAPAVPPTNPAGK